MAKKNSEKNKKQAPVTNESIARKKRGLLIYVPAFCTLVGTLMLLSVIAAAVPLTVPSFMGYDIYNVVSGSMEPTIPIGSIIYVKEIDPVDVDEGDIIVFESGESVVMHRVKENNIINGTYTTKGDANTEADLSEVRYVNLIGIVEKHIPVLGQLLTLFQSMVGRICMVCFAACGALLNVLGARFSEFLKLESEEERRREERLAQAMQAEEEAKTEAEQPEEEQGAEQPEEGLNAEQTDAV